MRTEPRRHRAQAVIYALGMMLAAALPSSARAYEDQLGFGIAAGYAYAAGSDTPSSAHGAFVNLEANLGLSATWSLRGTLGFGRHPRFWEGVFGIEALYLVDVLEFVPYAGLGVDSLLNLQERNNAQFAIGAHPVLGIDWLLDRNFVLGLCARPIFILSQLERSPLYLNVTINATWLLDL